MKTKIVGLLVGMLLSVVLFSTPVMAAANTNVVELGVNSGGVVSGGINNTNVVMIQTSHADVGTQMVLLPNGVWFDYGFYALQYSDVRDAVGTSYAALLNHYATYGIMEGRYPNSVAAANGQIIKGLPLNIVLMPNGVIFDANYYAMAYPDVTAVCGFDKAALYKHYIKNGAKEGRHPNAYTL